MTEKTNPAQKPPLMYYFTQANHHELQQLH